MTRLRLFLMALLVAGSASGALAQDPTPPARDTVRAGEMQVDTSAAARDSLRQSPPVFQDSVRPIPQLPDHANGPASGFSNGIWFWNHEALMREAPVTLGDLLDRIPGIVTIRSGYYLQPEAVTSLGGTGNRLEVWLDGYALDPLLESSFDVAKLMLANLESVRVERRLGTIRVFLQTLTAQDTRPYSLVEAAVGEPDANLFRGVFLAPRLFFGPLSLAIDRIDTDGLGRSEPADQFSGWAKWAYIRNGSGLEVEYRRTSTDRDVEAPWPAKWLRDDLIVRGRTRLFDRLVAEVFAGRSTLEIDTVTQGDNDSIPRITAENMQYGARASFSTPLFWARGALRVRDHESLASSQFDAAAGLTYGLLAASAQVTQTDWRDAGTASEFTVRAEAGPWKGMRVFAETTSSDRGVPFLSEPDDSTALAGRVPITPYQGVRAGGELDWRGITVGGALLTAKLDSTTTFGLPFDRSNQSFFGADATGWEVSGRVPLYFLKGLYAQGHIADWYTGNVSLYMPTRTYRAGLELHASPLRSGNLEILGRIEAIHRGAMLVPNFETGDDVEPAVSTQPADWFDAYLQIRIMTVRAFLRWEDLNGANVAEVPGRVLRGPRIFYGVKWEFFN